VTEKDHKEELIEILHGAKPYMITGRQPYSADVEATYCIRFNKADIERMLDLLGVKEIAL